MTDRSATYSTRGFNCAGGLILVLAMAWSANAAPALPHKKKPIPAFARRNKFNVGYLACTPFGAAFDQTPGFGKVGAHIGTTLQLTPTFGVGADAQFSLLEPPAAHDFRETRLLALQATVRKTVIWRPELYPILEFGVGALRVREIDPADGTAPSQTNGQPQTQARAGLIGFAGRVPIQLATGLMWGLPTKKHSSVVALLVTIGTTLPY